MNRRLITTVIVGALTACGSPLLTQNTCGIVFGGDYDDRLGESFLTEDTLQRATDAVIAESAITTEPKFIDQIENCRAFKGYMVYTRRVPNWFSEAHGFRISGFTSCTFRLIVIGTPRERRWQDSALPHELFHAMQGCEASMPLDPGMSEDHANWRRTNIMKALMNITVYP